MCTKYEAFLKKIFKKINVWFCLCLVIFAAGFGCKEPLQKHQKQKDQTDHKASIYQDSLHEIEDQEKASIKATSLPLPE